MKSFSLTPLILAVALSPVTAFAQPYDISLFDPTAKGKWAYKGKTTLVVPKVANGSITLDGAASAAEYGGFQGVEVTPGVGDGSTAAVGTWILDFPADRIWGGTNDSSFTFWLAHDDNFLYVGVQARDDLVNSNDPNASFWKDDAIEIVVDALNDRYDNNTDNSTNLVGGHCYVNFQGRFSGWDDTLNQKGTQMTWATGVAWTYGQNGDVFGSGKAATGGWQMEVRFHKRMFESATAGNKLRNGYRMGFNIGMDDDDKKGPAPGGDGTRSQDLEIQYFWANRERLQGYTSDFVAALTPDQIAGKTYLTDGSVTAGTVDSAGRLTHGGTGEILFGFDTPKAGKILFVTSATVGDNAPINADPALIALLRARGYTVTLFQADNSTPDGLRAAAQGQDLVIVSETIGSTTVLDPAGSGTGVFSLKDVNIPIISFEPYMYDNGDWVLRTTDGANDWINWGNSGRTEVDASIQDGRDSLYIQKSAHPIAGGLTGKVKVYNVNYSLNWGIPSADADVVASIEQNGKYPTIFVYDKGDKLTDGSVAPNKRIGFFIGQAANPNANWPTDYADLSDNGQTLLFNAIDYAIPGTQPPTLSIARSGSNIVITYAGGTLQSADDITATTWNNETVASGTPIAPSATKKFYRVKGS